MADSALSSSFIMGRRFFRMQCCAFCRFLLRMFPGTSAYLNVTYKRFASKVAGRNLEEGLVPI